MNEAAALPSPTVVLSARLKGYHGRLRRPPGSPSTSRLSPVLGRSAPAVADRWAGEDPPGPVVTIQTFHALYTGEFIGAEIQAWHAFHGLHPEGRGSALPCPPKGGFRYDAAGFA